MPTPGNSINEATTGITGFTGTAFVGTPVTQYNVLTGAATSSAVNNVAPSATSGVPLISQGASSHPVFGTAVVAGGGTGLTTTTAYGLITGGTTATGNFQNAGTGTSGQFYVSGGSAALGTWTTQSLRHIQTIEAQGQATFDFTTGISSSDNTYLFIISRLSTATDAQPVKLLVSTDGGSTFLTTAYVSGITYNPYNAATWTNQNSTTFYYVAHNVSSSGSTAQGEGTILFCNGTNGNASSIKTAMSWLLSGASMVSAIGTGSQTATTVNAFRFLASSGNLNAKISLFAVN